MTKKEMERDLGIKLINVLSSLLSECKGNIDRVGLIHLLPGLSDNLSL